MPALPRQRNSWPSRSPVSRKQPRALKTAEFEQRLHRRLHGKGNSSEFDLARSEHALEGVRNQLEVARQACGPVAAPARRRSQGSFRG